MLKRIETIVFAAASLNETLPALDGAGTKILGLSCTRLNSSVHTFQRCKIRVHHSAQRTQTEHGEFLPGRRYREFLRQSRRT